MSNALARLSLLLDLRAVARNLRAATRRSAVLVHGGRVSAEDGNAADNVAREMLREYTCSAAFE